MKDVKEKIADLRVKAQAKQKRYDELAAKSEALKSQLKTLGKELSDITGEIKKLETQSLIQTLESKGIAVSEIEEAVAAGIFAANTSTDATDEAAADNSTPTEPPAERDTYITNEQEETSDEIGGSRKALGNA